jgi:hypothetical protein
MEPRGLVLFTQNPLLSLMSPVYTFLIYVYKTHFNIILITITKYSM